MRSIHVRGPLLSKSGYGTHARQVVKWLSSSGRSYTSDITPWGITPWHLLDTDLGGLVGEIMRSSGEKGQERDVTIQIQLPHEWDPNLGKYNIGVTAGVESDKSSKLWSDCISRMDRVIVPSRFAKETLVKSGSPADKIFVIPESFSESLEVEREKSSIDLSGIETKFNFLLFGQLTGTDPDSDRKNIFYSVKWFCEEFKGNRDVGLVVKTNMGTNCVFHRGGLNSTFKKLLSEVRQGEFPRVYLLNGEMSEAECSALYHNEKIGCMLSLTKGEGYGLPLVDAAAAGLPVIATDWSGHLDFLNLGKFSKVQYDLVDVPQKMIDNRIFIPGAKWAMPREADAKKRMRKMVESPSVPREWAKELSKTIQERLRQSAVERTYEEIIGAVL